MDDEYTLLASIRLTFAVALLLVAQAGVSDGDAEVQPRQGKYKVRSPYGPGNCVLANVTLAAIRYNTNYSTIHLVDLEDSPRYSYCAHNEAHLRISFTSRNGYIDFLIAREDEHSPMEIKSVALKESSVFNKRYKFEGFRAQHANHSYRCYSEQHLRLTEQSRQFLSHREPIPPVELVLANVTIEAFRDAAMPYYYQPEDICDSDRTQPATTSPSEVTPDKASDVAEQEADAADGGHWYTVLYVMMAIIILAAVAFGGYILYGNL